MFWSPHPHLQFVVVVGFMLSIRSYFPSLPLPYAPYLKPLILLFSFPSQICFPSTLIHVLSMCTHCLSCSYMHTLCSFFHQTSLVHIYPCLISCPKIHISIPFSFFGAPLNISLLSTHIHLPSPHQLTTFLLFSMPMPWPLFSRSLSHALSPSFLSFPYSSTTQFFSFYLVSIVINQCSHAYMTFWCYLRLSFSLSSVLHILFKGFYISSFQIYFQVSMLLSTYGHLDLPLALLHLPTGSLIAFPSFTSLHHLPDLSLCSHFFPCLHLIFSLLLHNYF